MYLLPSALIDSILNKYTERVNSKSGYYKIPYESWRLLKKLASSDLIFEVETKLKKRRNPPMFDQRFPPLRDPCYLRFCKCYERKVD